MSQTLPGEPGVFSVQLLVFLQMHLVMVDCSETGCAECLDSESSVLRVDLMVRENYICKTIF